MAQYKGILVIFKFVILVTFAAFCIHRASFAHTSNDSKTALYSHGVNDSVDRKMYLGIYDLADLPARLLFLLIVPPAELAFKFRNNTFGQ